jgi:N-carbamoylputrescine amidase
MSAPDGVTVALLQMRCNRSRQDNLSRAADLLRQAARQGANIACLPELFLSLYFCQSEDQSHFALAETIPGPTTEALSALAAELQIVVLAGLFEQRTPGVYHNTCVVIDADGSLSGRYRKMHIPDDPQYYEKFYFTPGDLGFQSFSTRFANAGTLICWDQWFPEAARLTALRGAHILFYPTAIGWFPHEKDECGQAQVSSWQLVQQAHAVANGCFVAAVNRIGHEGDPSRGIEFWGQSFICDTQGQLLAQASSNQEEIICATIDLAEIDRTRTAWPFLRDRRIDAYGDLKQRYCDSPER